MTRNEILKINNYLSQGINNLSFEQYSELNYLLDKAKTEISKKFDDHFAKKISRESYHNHENSRECRNCGYVGAKAFVRKCENCGHEL